MKLWQFWEFWFFSPCNFRSLAFWTFCSIRCSKVLFLCVFVLFRCYHLSWKLCYQRGKKIKITHAQRRNESYQSRNPVICSLLLWWFDYIICASFFPSLAIARAMVFENRVYCGVFGHTQSNWMVTKEQNKTKQKRRKILLSQCQRQQNNFSGMLLRLLHGSVSSQFALLWLQIFLFYFHK